jgi:hypothetical protein
MSALKRIVISTRRVVGALVLTVSLSVFVVQFADGRPARISKTPDKGKSFGCATCHTSRMGGGRRNPFGKDYQKIALKAGDKYTVELGAIDSDGDGFTNDQEFAAGTHPGDPDSKPGK